jgi:hypothetical protein
MEVAPPNHRKNNHNAILDPGTVARNHKKKTSEEKKR